MELIGEEEIQEVLEVLRGGYLFRYGISLGAEVDPTAPVRVSSLAGILEFELVPYKYAAGVAAGVGLLGLALAVMGLYGSVAFSVPKVESITAMAIQRPPPAKQRSATSAATSFERAISSIGSTNEYTALMSK